MSGSKEAIGNSYIDAQKALHAAAHAMPMDRRVALMTGVSKGNIGHAIAARLMRDGFIIFAPDFPNAWDVREPADRVRVLHEAGPDVDTLICCHGWTDLAWLEDADPEEVVRMVETNLTATMLLVRDFVRFTLLLPYRKHIVLIGSMAGTHVLNASAAYCASKAGLAMYVRAAAWELAPKGYDVFGVNPSNTEGTPMTAKTIDGLARYRGLSREEATAYWGACLPKAAWLQPADIAGVVAFLLSGAGSYLSGANLDLAGGQR